MATPDRPRIDIANNGIIRIIDCPDDMGVCMISNGLGLRCAVPGILAAAKKNGATPDELQQLHQDVAPNLCLRKRRGF